jgi:DnaJ-class molecular chaperone
MTNQDQTKVCPECSGRGRLQESMGSRAVCGFCEGYGRVSAGGKAVSQSQVNYPNLVESNTPRYNPSQRLTD